MIWLRITHRIAAVCVQAYNTYIKPIRSKCIQVISSLLELYFPDHEMPHLLVNAASASDVGFHASFFLLNCFYASVSHCVQSRSQSRQASWSVGGRREGHRG